MSVSPEDFRRTLGAFASGVTVMTAVGSQGRPVGVTVSAFSSLSLEPPLVLFCLDKRTAALEAFTEGTHFLVNILAEGQGRLSNVFAAPEADRFAGVDFQTWDSGCAALDGALAHLECRRTAVHDGGDHVIVVGEVERVAWHEGRRPLVYAQGAYHSLAE